MATTQNVKLLEVGAHVVIEEVATVIGGGEILEIHEDTNRIVIAQKCYYRGELVDTLRVGHFLGGYKSAQMVASELVR